MIDNAKEKMHLPCGHYAEINTIICTIFTMQIYYTFCLECGAMYHTETLRKWTAKKEGNNETNL